MTWLVGNSLKIQRITLEDGEYDIQFYFNNCKICHGDIDRADMVNNASWTHGECLALDSILIAISPISE